VLHYCNTGDDDNGTGGAIGWSGRRRSNSDWNFGSYMRAIYEDTTQSSVYGLRKDISMEEMS
jgi:hypothetical protein